MKRLSLTFISTGGWIAVSALAFMACGQLDRESLLSGDFGNVDRTAPVLVSPVNGTRIVMQNGTSGEVNLIWEAKLAASTYTVEIARNILFTDQVSGSPFQITQTNELKYTINSAETYYWRVKANMSSDDTFSTIGTFHAFDAVYVYCPSSTSSCTNTERTGNKTSPFEIISDALTLAKGLGVEVRVAARGGTSSYFERISLLAGVTVKGGYSASDWSRDIASNITRIEHDSGRIISAEFLQSSTGFTFDGFSLVHSASANSSYAFYIQKVNRNLTISNNSVQIAPTSSSAAISIENGASPIILRNKINGSTESNIGIRAANNSLAIIMQNEIIGQSSVNFVPVTLSQVPALVFNNKIVAGGGATSRALSISGSTTPPGHVIIGNKIDAGSGTTWARGINCSLGSNPDTARLLINNYIKVNTGPETYGIYTYICRMLLSNNTIHGGEGTNAYAYNSGAFKAPQLDANILFSASSGNHYGFYENHASSVEPNPMRKNNIFNLSGAGTFYFYRDADANGMCHTGGVSSAGNCASIADMEADLNAELTGTPAINNFNFDNSGNQLFQNVGDMLENGWEIKSTAAVVINFGLNCPGEYSVKTFLWGEATSQSECNEKFPGVGSNYNSGNCENTYLYPAVEINSNGLVTGNGLCESGEICLMNPNVGAYAGHGALVDGGCDVSGLINDVSLLRYGTNGR